MKRRVILLGPPGSGKGTVADRLVSDFGLNHVSSGNLLRREVENKTPLGCQVELFLEKGELVPDEVMLEFMEWRLLEFSAGPGFLLDGFPRTIAQAEALDQWLAARDLSIQAVLLLECRAEVIILRITGRRVCANCSRVYHIPNNPPRIPGKCDACGSEVVQREDDTEPVVRKRLEVYGRQTEPLVAYYRSQRILSAIDAAQDGSKMCAAAVKVLN
jgi:adenylate kinase